jgi:hypothetical protein
MPRVREGDAVLDPSRPRYETAVEKQIREAQERGAFDDLPGKGKPLPGIDGPDDELWWVKNMIRREGLSTDLLLPPSIQLRKEIDRLPETLRGLRSEQAVRDLVHELNLRIVEYLRVPDGPRVPVRRISADDAVAQWRAERERPTPSVAPSAPAPPQPRSRWWRRRPTPPR